MNDGKLDLDLGLGGLLVEAPAADDMVHGVGMRDVIAVSTSTYLALAVLLGQPVALQISLAYGTRESFAGDSEVDILCSEERANALPAARFAWDLAPRPGTRETTTACLAT